MLKIGRLKLKSNLILAPISGVSDLPFRLLNRGFGCELAFTEMINVRSLGHKSIKTQQLLATKETERPLGVQILGGDPVFILRGLEILRKYKFDILDFNAACPAKKVTRRGEGASLMREPGKLSALLKVVVKNAQVPVTVKIRSGWDKDQINAKDVAKACADAGVDGVFIHGRTRAQEYSGHVDYAVIRQVKKALKIPLIASGDILSAALAKRMFDETGCDGVLIARGAFGNPWIFGEIPYFLKHGTQPGRPSLDMIIATMTGHFQACVDFYGLRVSVVVFRKFFSWYTRGMRSVRHLREEANRARTAEGLLRVIEACRNCPGVL